MPSPNLYAVKCFIVLFINKSLFAEIEKMGFEKEDQVIGLMMYLGDEEDLELIEHLLVENRSKCFEMKQIAEESSNAYYECARIKAIVKDGKILNVIEELEVL